MLHFKNIDYLIVIDGLISIVVMSNHLRDATTLRTGRSARSPLSGLQCPLYIQYVWYSFALISDPDVVPPFPQQTEAISRDN